MRQYLIAERLADTRGIAYDREVLLCASFLHDAGLYGPASSGDVYIKDSARYARRTLEPLGWPEQRRRVCIDACEQHHALTSRWWMSSEVELVRRSDLVEVLPELFHFGIPRSWLKRQLWQAVRRAGFWPATRGNRQALSLTDRVHGRKLAESLQLAIEYDPQPPFNSGSPTKADASTLRLAFRLLAGDRPVQFVTQVLGQASAARLRRARYALSGRRQEKQSAQPGIH